LKLFTKVIIHIFILIFLVSYSEEKMKSISLDEQDNILTLDKCISLVLSRNAFISSAFYSVKAREKEIDEAKANYYYPNIDLGVKYMYQKETPESTFPLAPHKFSTSLSINKILYSFGRLGNQLSIAENNHRIAKLDYYKKRNDIVKSVILSFYNVLLNQQNLKVMHEGYLIQKENLEFHERNYKIGKIPKFNYLRVKIQFEDDKINVMQAKNNLIKAINELYTLIGMKLISSLKEINFKIEGDFKLRNYNKIALNLDEYIHRGKHFRVEILKLSTQKKNLELGRDIANTGWKPIIVAFASVTTDYTQKLEFAGVFPNISFGLGNFATTSNWNVGVQMTLSLSDLIIPNSKSHSKAKSMDYEAKSVNESLKDTVKLINQEITQNYILFKEAERNIKRRKLIMELSNENFRIVKKKYDTGGIDYLNYRDAEQQYRLAQLSYNKELYSFNIAYINLLVSVGEPLR